MSANIQTTALIIELAVARMLGLAWANLLKMKVLLPSQLLAQPYSLVPDPAMLAHGLMFIAGKP